MSGGGRNSAAGMEYVWPGRVTLVIDPYYFWMQLGTRESMYQFEQLHRELQQYCRQGFTPIANMEDLEPGQLVIVDTDLKDGPRWRRGVVTRIMPSDHSVDVFYVDYGNTELSSATKICLQFPPQFKSVPPQAVRCFLAGVKPISKSWTSRGTKTFQRLTEGQMVKVLVLYGEPGYCEVSLYPSSEENGRSVSHRLLEEEVAMAVEDREVPEFLQDVPAFMAKLMAPSGCSSQPATTSSSKPETSPSIKPTSACASTEKYIPPHQKNISSSSGTSGVSGYSQHGTPPGFMQQPSSMHEQSPPSRNVYQPNNRSPTKSLASAGVELKEKEPVNDFFPFENVSVYPCSPSSPVKSPERGNNNGIQGQGHYQSQGYFTRSSYGTDRVGNHGNMNSHSGRVTGADPRQNGHHRNPPNRTPDNKSRFAANFDNLPTNTFEPSYLNNQVEYRVENTYSSPGRSPVNRDLFRSPEKEKRGGEDSSLRPKLYIPSRENVPFYPPKQHQEDLVTTTAAQPRQAVAQRPPSFQQAPPQGTGDTYQYPGLSSPVKSYTGTLPNSYQNYQSNSTVGSQYYSAERETHPGNKFSSHLSPGLYHSPERSDRSPNHNNSNNHYANPQMYSPTDGGRHYHGYDHQSPESPAIAGFNFSDLDHTHLLSKDVLHERNQQERLQALQEEQEDIARESEQQSALVTMSRYGTRNTDRQEDHDYPTVDNPSPDIGEPVLEDIHYHSQYSSLHTPGEYDELRKSPVKLTRKPQQLDVPGKLEGMPSNFIADIDFAEALKETLEFSRVDGKIENTKALLDGIVESLKNARVEKQLYDVLLMMLAYAVRDYNQFHILLLETIHSLSAEMEIKECLLKALKRQQELCIRVGASKDQSHQNCARVMGHVYNMAVEWCDTNSTLQDYIIQTVEKWVLFNNKGQQIGQQEKENIFLDCFTAFWEVSGSKLLHCSQSFTTRIYPDLRKKILNENVSRSIRERLLDDIYMELYTKTGKVESQTVSTQTPRKTMIPSSCQVKPVMTNAATWTPSDWADDLDCWNVDPDKPWPTRDHTSLGDSLHLRPLPQHHSSPLVCANMSMNTETSFISATSDSIYLTPNDTLGKENHDKIASKHFPGKGNLIDAFREPSDVVKEPDLDFASVASSSAKHDPETKRDVKELGNKEQVKCSAIVKGRELAGSGKTGESNNTLSERISAAGKSIVDWFDYEPPAVDTNVSLEEKKLKTKKKLDSASMNIIESEIESKYCVSKMDLKGKTKKDKKKGKADDTGKANQDRCNNNNKSVSGKAECIDMPVMRGHNEVSENSGTDFEEGNLKREEMNSYNFDEIDDSKVFGESSIDDHAVETANEMEEQIEDWEKGFDNHVPVMKREKKVEEEDIDWWGVGKMEDASSGATDLTGKGEIHLECGPDVIIEGEFEKDFDDLGLSDGRKNNKDFDDTYDDQSSRAIVDSGVYKQDIYEEGGGDNEEKAVQEFKGDIFAFDIDNNWESDDDDFELNGKQDTEYDKEVADSDLQTSMHADVVSEGPGHSRWVAGESKCSSCHEMGHSIENCPNRFLVLQ